MSQDVLDQRPARNLVQTFGSAGLHPRALAGGKDDDVSISHRMIEAIGHYERRSSSARSSQSAITIFARSMAA